MPAWLVALLVALVGLAGVLIGTFANIAHQRGAELRTRMLEAADEFVTAASRAHEIIGLAALPVGLWVEIASMEMSEEMRTDRQGKAEDAQENAEAAWDASRQRVPRIVLLFGVDSPAAIAAKRVDDALGETVVGFAEAYAATHRSDAREPEPAEENLVVEKSTEQLEVAERALRDFSAAARVAITGTWWRRPASANAVQTNAR